MSIGPLQLVLVILLVVLLFGTKKLGNIGSDLGKAIRDFKKGMGDDDKDKNKDESAHKSESADRSETPQADASDDAARKDESSPNDSPRH